LLEWIHSAFFWFIPAPLEAMLHPKIKDRLLSGLNRLGRLEIKELCTHFWGKANLLKQKPDRHYGAKLQLLKS